MEYWCYFFPAFAVATPLWFWFWSSAKKGFGWSPGGCAGWKTIPNLTDSTKGSQGLVGLVDVLRIITGILTQSILPQGFWKEFIRIVNEKNWPPLMGMQWHDSPAISNQNFMRSGLFLSYFTGYLALKMMDCCPYPSCRARLQSWCWYLPSTCVVYFSVCIPNIPKPWFHAP